MASLKELHQLVHRLNKAEARHLTLYIQSYAGKSKDSYLQQIDKLKAVKKIDDKNSKSISVKTKRVSEFNTNLYDFICKALLAYENKGNLALSIQKDNLLADILIRKKQFKQAQKLINNNIEKYSSYGLDELILYSHKLKYRIDVQQRADFDTIVENTIQKTTLSNSLANESEYVRLNFEMNKLFTDNYSIRTQEQADVYVQFLQHKLLQDVSCAQSNYAKHYFYMIKIPLLFILNKYDEAIALAQEATAFAKVNFDLNINFIPYLFQLIRYLNLQTNMGRSLHVNETIEAIEQVFDYLPNNHSKLKYRLSILDAKLCVYIYDKKYAEGVAYFENEAKELFDDKINQVARIDAKASLVARLYYLNGDYEKSLAYCEIALSDKQFIFTDSVIAIRFLILLNHIRMKNHQLVPYSALSLKRLLDNQERLFAPEKALLLFLEKINDINKLHKNLQKLYITLQDEIRKPFNSTFFDSGDYLEWLKDFSDIDDVLE